MFYLLVYLVGALIILIGFIWSCILAYRQSILWLLAYVFVPFAALVFLAKHWAEAKRPFVLKLLGFGLMALPIVLSPDLRNAFREHYTGGRTQDEAMTGTLIQAANKNKQAGAARAPEPSAGLLREQAAAAEQELRMAQRLEKQNAYNKHCAEADVMFKDLSERRAKLKPGDKEATAVFNQDAARYQALLARIKAEKTELEAAGPTAPTVLAKNAGAAPALPPANPTR